MDLQKRVQGQQVSGEREGEQQRSCGSEGEKNESKSAKDEQTKSDDSTHDRGGNMKIYSLDSVVNVSRTLAIDSDGDFEQNRFCLVEIHPVLHFTPCFTALPCFTSLLDSNSAQTAMCKLQLCANSSFVFESVRRLCKSTSV